MLPPPTVSPPHPLRIVTAVFAACVALLLTAATGDALVIKSAAVTQDPVKGDSFSVKGEFGALPLDSATVIALEFDGFFSGFRVDELKRRKLQLSFKGPSGAPGLVQLVIDLKKRRFTAKGAHVLLPGVPDPITIRLGADGTYDCALLPLVKTGSGKVKPGAKPKAVHFKVPRGQQAAACLVAVPVSATPPAVVVDVPTSVQFQATPAAGVTLDAGSLQLFAADASGFPQGAPLCTLSDDGSAGDLLAGDGIYSCLATISEAATGALALVVQGTAASTPLRSPTLFLPIVAPTTDADITAIFDIQEQAGDIWDTQSAALGDTLNARLATIRAIAALPGVAAAELSPDGMDIVIRYTSGHLGGLMLSPRFGDVASPSATPTPAASTAASPTPAALTATSRLASARATAPLAVSHTATAATSRDTVTCPPNPARTLVGSLSAIILTTSYFGANDDWPIAKRALDNSCLHFDVTVADLTVDALLGITQYSTVILSTHGFVDDDFGINIVTDETATVDSFGTHAYSTYFNDFELYPLMLPKNILGGGRNVFVVTPAFLANVPGHLDHGLVYASHCRSAFNGSEAAAFQALGADAFFGFTGATSYNFARITSGTVLPALTQNFFTTGDAYAGATKVDPTPVKHDPIAKGFKRGVVFVHTGPSQLILTGDHALAYVDHPTLTPESMSLDEGEATPFTVAVDDRADTCDLTYQWTTSIDVGTLSDDMGDDGAQFETTDQSVTFTANPDTVGTASVIVGARAPGTGDGPGPFFGEACAVVDVRGCGDNVVQDGEQCDGTDDSACPGQCGFDCQCFHVPVCGDNHRDPGELCDGTDKEVCDSVSVHGDGICHPDCEGCARCGDGVIDANEECDTADDSTCPGVCRSDCTCGCAVGDPGGCPATQCCNGLTHECCTPSPFPNISDPPKCPFGMSGCCGGGPLPPGTCGGDLAQGQGEPGTCPDANCADTTGYDCLWCDNKFISGICDSSNMTCAF